MSGAEDHLSAAPAEDRPDAMPRWVAAALGTVLVLMASGAAYRGWLASDSDVRELATVDALQLIVRARDAVVLDVTPREAVVRRDGQVIGEVGAFATPATALRLESAGRVSFLSIAAPDRVPLVIRVERQPDAAAVARVRAMLPHRE